MKKKTFIRIMIVNVVENLLKFIEIVVILKECPNFCLDWCLHNLMKYFILKSFTFKTFKINKIQNLHFEKIVCYHIWKTNTNLTITVHFLWTFLKYTYVRILFKKNNHLWFYFVKQFKGILIINNATYSKEKTKAFITVTENI